MKIKYLFVALPPRNFQLKRLANTATLNANTRDIIREGVLKFYVKQQNQDGQEGITACYERLSQEDKNDGESNSIANQKMILERYCKEHDYTSIFHYEDDGFSGTNFDRPGFQRMLADIKAGRITRVIVKDMSRFGRDYLQVGVYTDVVFPEFGVHFIAVNDGVDSTRGDNEFTAIRNVFNEMFARDTSKKIRASLQSKGKSGERLCTVPHYGYMKDPNDNKKWIVDEEAAAVVQKIFSLCVDGMGPTMIANWLSEHKIKNPTAYFTGRGLPVTNPPANDPYKWFSTTVCKILGRMEYLGHTVNFRTFNHSYKNRKSLFNDPDKWRIFENTHEPIIEESVFMIVQNIRNGRKRLTKSGDMGIFHGLMYCGDCGGKMYLTGRNSNNPKYVYHVCANYRKDRNLCTPHTIRNDLLNDIVLRNLKEAIAYVSSYEDDFVREAADNSIRERDRELAAQKKTLIEADGRIVELDLIIKRLYEDNGTGKLTDERFMKLSRDFELEQSNLKAAAEALRQELQERELKKSNFKSFIETTKKYTDLQELDASVLREFIARIELFDLVKSDGEQVREINIVYNFIGAFDFEAVTAKADNNSNSREREDRKTA